MKNHISCQLHWLLHHVQTCNAHVPNPPLLLYADRTS